MAKNRNRMMIAVAAALGVSLIAATVQPAYARNLGTEVKFHFEELTQEEGVEILENESETIELPEADGAETENAALVEAEDPQTKEPEAADPETTEEETTEETPEATSEETAAVETPSLKLQTEPEEETTPEVLAGYKWIGGVFCYVAEDGTQTPYTGIYHRYLFVNGAKQKNKNMLVLKTQTEEGGTQYKVLAPSSAKKNPEAVIYIADANGKVVTCKTTGLIDLTYKLATARFFVENGKILTGTKTQYRTVDGSLYSVTTVGKASIYSGVYKGYFYRNGKIKKSKKAYFCLSGKYLYKVAPTGKATRYRTTEYIKNYYITAYGTDGKRYFCIADPTTAAAKKYILNAEKTGTYYKRTSDLMMWSVNYQTAETKTVTGLVGNRFYSSGRLLTSKDTLYKVYNNYVYKLSSKGYASIYIKDDTKSGSYLLDINGKYYYVYYKTGKIDKEAKDVTPRSLLLATALSYEGYNEADGTYKEILKIYNSYRPLPDGYMMSLSDPWCACYVSAMFIKAGLYNKCALGVSCGRQVELWKEMGCWIENDAYEPEPGDIIFYHWDCSNGGDCRDWPGHTGIVISCEGGWIKVIEGNYSERVMVRTISVNDSDIRGFASPNY